MQIPIFPLPESVMDKSRFTEKYKGRYVEGGENISIRSINVKSGFCLLSAKRINRKDYLRCKGFIDGASDNCSLVCTFPDEWLFEKMMREGFAGRTKHVLYLLSISLRKNPRSAPQLCRFGI